MKYLVEAATIVVLLIILVVLLRRNSNFTDTAAPAAPAAPAATSAVTPMQNQLMQGPSTPAVSMTPAPTAPLMVKDGQCVMTLSGKCGVTMNGQVADTNILEPVGLSSSSAYEYKNLLEQ